MNASRRLLLVLMAVSAGCGGRTSLEEASVEVKPPVVPSMMPPPVRPPALEMSCPTSANDPRLPSVAPEGLTELDAAAFVRGPVQSYKWSIREQDCDAIVPRAGYILQNSSDRVVRFHPARPGTYRLQLTVVGAAGDKESCEFSFDVEGRGLRVELCWDTSTSTDLDLYLHSPFNESPWFDRAELGVVEGMTSDTCNTANCTPELRFGLARVNWGYPDSALSTCNAGPNSKEFLALRRCPNPRAGDDNNQKIANGTTERIQLDNPRDQQRFSIMVQNFSNTAASPHVFVYCGSKRAGELLAPNEPRGFVAPDPGRFGVMWRASHVITTVDAAGQTSSCRLEPNKLGLTIDNPEF